MRHFSNNEGFQIAVQDCQRRARDAVNQVVVGSSALFETACLIEVRAAQLDKASIRRNEKFFSDSETMFKKHSGYV